jgi:hypothetical protein
MADRRWGDAAEMAVIELVDHPELDRKRKPKAAGAAKAEGAAEQPKDPFGRFRKLFAGKSKVAGGKAKAAGAKTGAARKTPASGSNKSGGSSS